MFEKNGFLRFLLRNINGTVSSEDDDARFELMHRRLCGRRVFIRHPEFGNGLLQLRRIIRSTEPRRSKYWLRVRLCLVESLESTSAWKVTMKSNQLGNCASFNNYSLSIPRDLCPATSGGICLPKPFSTSCFSLKIRSRGSRRRQWGRERGKGSGDPTQQPWSRSPGDLQPCFELFPPSFPSPFTLTPEYQAA
jgi:hypothetical protein